MSTTSPQSSAPIQRAAKPYKGMAMEGLIARWYTKNTAQGREFDAIARRIRALLPEGGRILEVAPGPGYLSINLARDACYQVTGLDISQTFVEIARGKAAEAGVSVDFRQGNASQMPFEAGSFDLSICVAAFKNFTEPVEAIREMHRVLKPGGIAIIDDLRKDASMADISAAVERMQLSPINAFLTRGSFRFLLLKNAYTQEQMRAFVLQTLFSTCEVQDEDIGMEIFLRK
jgi:ubiquinone/menaquinone biosynthesis C-methylase UbiE